MSNENARRCKQCGELKPLDHYRKYYGNRKGRYTVCLQCQKINARHKYLSDKLDYANCSDAEREELDKINLLYDLQRNLGLFPPRTEVVRSTTIETSVDALLGKYQAMPKNVQMAVGEPPVPHELQVWLSAELDKEPEYYLDEVYAALAKQYRPQLYIDQTTLLPVHDNSHKKTLDAILERFNKYEDEYYDK